MLRAGSVPRAAPKAPAARVPLGKALLGVDGKSFQCLFLHPLPMRKLFFAILIAVIFGGGWGLLYFILG